MLEGYERDRFGVIKQLNPKDVDYSGLYQQRIKDRGHQNNLNMSYLRYGYMVGALGFVPQSLLDVGYGDGAFLEFCSQKIKCFGNEISGAPIPEGCEFVSDITKGSYQVITFFDSLEHFKSLDFIGDLNCSYIYLSVPCCRYDSDEWFRDWKHRKPDEHIWHFNTDSIQNLFWYYKYDAINLSFIEDIIRKADVPNILSVVFSKL